MEVEALAGVFHPNVVRYYQAWIEGGISGDRINRPTTEDDEDDEDDRGCDEDDAAAAGRAGRGEDSSSDGSLEEEEEEEVRGDDERFQEWSALTLGSADPPRWRRPATTPLTTSSSSSSPKGAGATLYIQMEYCATTLRELIDGNELWQRVDDVWRLTRQMVDAIAYLHGLGMVHRDLKPANAHSTRPRSHHLERSANTQKTPHFHTKRTLCSTK